MYLLHSKIPKTRIVFLPGAIFHCQSQAAVLASLVAGNEFRIANQEMLEVLTIGFTTITHRCFAAFYFCS